MAPRPALLMLWPAAAMGAVEIPTLEVAPGVRMPVISIGTGGEEMSDATAIVTNWLQLGGRGLDAAYDYRNQQKVAHAISKAGVDRKSLFITSKVPGCADVRHFVEQNLKDLGTDYLDLLLIHFPRFGSCPRAWKTLETYYQRGTLRAIGVSNFQRSDLEPLLATASVVPHVNQIQLNVLEPDADTRAFCLERNITVEAYSPLGRAGSSGDIPANPKIQQVAANHGVSTYQVALRWVLQHGHLMTFQSTSSAHQQEDADIFGFSLTAEEMSALDQLGFLGSAAVLV